MRARLQTAFTDWDILEIYIDLYINFCVSNLICRKLDTPLVISSSFRISDIFFGPVTNFDQNDQKYELLKLEPILRNLALHLF